MQLQDPAFASLLWKMTPASFAVRLSGGQYRTWPYLQLLSRKLVDLAVGRIKRLIVVMPPRHSKSETGSKWFPAWYTELFPQNRIILSSYEMDFATTWGAKVRDILIDNKDLLTVQHKVKMPAAHRWETTAGGGMTCAGAGGPITGKGANLLILDDVIKNAEEANSPTIREKTWEWYTSTVRSRMEPGGSMLMIGTRWHSDDLTGRILQCEKENLKKKAEGDAKAQVEGWEVFCFPALAEPEAEVHYRSYGVPVNELRLGALDLAATRAMLRREGSDQWRDFIGRRRGEALCPDRYTEDDLAKFRSLSQRDWFALFQQRPGDEADEGNVYHQFDETKTVRDLTRDDRMQLFISMDFNVDPMCAVIGQYERGVGPRILERCEILEELALPNSNTPDMMFHLIGPMGALQKYKRGYTLDIEIYGDSAGSQRSPNSAKTNWQIVAEHLNLDRTLHARFIRRRANPRIMDRVNAVNNCLKAADGTMRLFVQRQLCPELVKDFKKVSWATDSGGNSTGLLEKGKDKHRTHISDALGYMVEYTFSLRMQGGGRKGIVM
jgi:hypothetical protein